MTIWANPLILQSEETGPERQVDVSRVTGKLLAEQQWHKMGLGPRRPGFEF